MSYKQYAKVIIHGTEVIEKMKFESLSNIFA